MEPNLAAIGTMLSQRLSSDHLESLARQTGFLRRHRKVTPLAWLQVCCGTVSMGVISMRLCAISLGWLSRQVISKQALAQRLTSASAAFVKAVMLQEFQRQSRLGRAQSKASFPGSTGCCRATAPSAPCPRNWPGIFREPPIKTGPRPPQPSSRPFGSCAVKSSLESG